MVSCLSSSDAHIDLKVIDCTFYDGPDLIKSDPIIGIPLDSGKFAEVHVFIGISGTPLFRSAAWIWAVIDILPFHHMDFGTAPFFAVDPAFFVTMPEMFHSERRIVWTGGITVKVLYLTFGRVLSLRTLHFSGSHRFLWCQKQSHQEKYRVKTGDGAQNSRPGQGEVQRSPLQTYPRPGNPISFPLASQDELL